MTILDFDKFKATPLQRAQCDYIIVPEFVRADALAEINRDFPAITQAGNFHTDQVKYGPGFQAFMDELTSPDLRRLFSAKFGFDLEGFPKRYRAGHIDAPGFEQPRAALAACQTADAAGRQPAGSARIRPSTCGVPC